MIRGVGIDIVEIKRIKDLIIKYERHFLEKVFTQAEIMYCSAKAFPEIHFAGRWAVKEAFYKALPVFLQSKSTWKSIETVPGRNSGKPVIAVLSNELNAGLKSENITSVQVSVSHERLICTAIVIIE